MDRVTARTAFIALTMATIVVLGGCMDASLSQSGNAPASISILDAPGAIPEVGISITGGGVNISETLGPGTDALVFELPVGREHQVAIDTTNFIGRRSFVLPPGGAQIDVRMLEKLFVPDLFNQHLVVVGDMRGGGWSTNTNVFWPLDVEVGPDGRIYLAAQEDLSEQWGRIRVLDSISDTTPTDIATPYGVVALAVDSSNQVLYYAGDDGTGLYLEAISLEGDFLAGYTTLIDDFSQIWGLAVGKSGDVYLSGIRQVFVEVALGDGVLVDRPAVRRFSPDSAFVPADRIIGPDVPSNSEPEIDVLFNNGKLYVTNPNGMQSNKIVQLDANTLEPVGSFGSFPAELSDPQPGELYGPRRFVATGNALITVIDESSSSLHDRLVQFAPDRSNWRTYGTTGTGQGEFQFFYVF